MKKVLFKYYEIYSERWYDSRSKFDFADADIAIDFATKSDGYFPPYNLYEKMICEDENGFINIDSKYLMTIPNREVRQAEFYVIECSSEKDKVVVPLSSYRDVELYSEDNDWVKIHKVTVTLNDKDALEYTYDLLKDNKKLTKK